MTEQDPTFPCQNCNRETSLYILTCQICGRAALSKRELQLVTKIEGVIGGNLPAMAMLNISTEDELKRIHERAMREAGSKN